MPSNMGKQLLLVLSSGYFFRPLHDYSFELTMGHPMLPPPSIEYTPSDTTRQNQQRKHLQKSRKTQSICCNASCVVDRQR
jgi:hypothetical protein